MNPALLRGMTAIPGLASRFSGSTAGLTLRQAAPAAGALLNRGMTAAQFMGGGMIGALGTALSLGGDSPQVERRGGASLPKDYAYQERLLGAQARADQIRRGGSGAGGSIGGGNMGGYTGGSSFSASQAGSSPAAERAYQQEASRVAQLTAQDPELQRYEKAREGAKTQADMNAARDIGMQIWQEKYGGTKMAQPGGAVGSFNPLMQSTFGYQTGMAPGQVSAMQQTAAPIPVAPGEVPYFQGDLGTRATLETGYDPAAYGLTPGKIEDMKSKLLKQAAVNSASSVTK
jgi:hypothetical protein